MGFVPCVLCASVAMSAVSSPLVHIGKLDIIHFKSHALDATRTVRVWTPPALPHGVRSDVLYLNDGQNLFGDGDPESGGGGWHVDETAARLIADHEIGSLLVVGIDNAGDRSRGIDYLPVRDPFSADPAEPGADRYLRFVIDELIPYINKHYATLRGSEHTGFGGSSYGAASAFYAALSRPGVFGRLLLESPSVGVGNAVMLDQAAHVSSWPERIAMGIGTGEGRGGRGPNSAFQTLVDLLRRDGLGDDRLKVVVQEDGRHNEATWASRFPAALAFLFRPQLGFRNSSR
jgi:enterochelin esterase-like enzyme